MSTHTKIAVLGHGGAGKSALVLQFVCNHFVEEYDPTLEEDHRKQVLVDEEVALLEILDESYSDYSSMREQWIRHSDFIIVCHSYTFSGLEETRRTLETIRRVKDTDDKVLPVFVTASKTDLWEQRVVTREQIIEVAAKHGAAGFYETSAKARINVETIFFDATRFVRKQKRSADDLAKAKKELAKLSGPAGLLPWNWGKKAEWNAKLKRLDFYHVSAPVSEKDIEAFRFPEPEVKKNPLAFYKDIATLLDSAEGKACADVYLCAEHSTAKHAAHRVVLCLRSKYFRDLLLKAAPGATVELSNVGSDEALTEVLLFFYTNELRPGLNKELLAELTQFANALASAELGEAVRHAQSKAGAKALRAIESSELVQKEMKPALSDLKELSDVTITVEKHKFRLHRAILSARCKWLSVLLAERWQHGDAQKGVEVTSMSADVFATVAEFLYTGRAQVAEEIAIEVLAAADMLGLPRLTSLAELALQPVIDAGNAVPVYLAATHYAAKQLQATCVYWMSVEYEAAQKNKQWSELPGAVQASVKAEHDRLAAKRAAMREERVLMQQLPCVLARHP